MRFFQGLGALAMTVGWPVLALACPACSQSWPKNLAHGFYLSYILLMAAPFLTIGAVALLLIRSSRRRIRPPTHS